MSKASVSRAPRKALRCSSAILSAAVAAALPLHAARATPTVQSLSDTHGKYYLVNNGSISFQLYTTGALAGKITSITYSGQQMVGSKDLYYDVQGSPGIFLGGGSTYAFRTGSNFVDISGENPATSTTPLDVTWHWIIRDGDPGFSTYLTYHHTSAMADYSSNENRLGAEFLNESLFHYSSIADNFWGYQAAGDPSRDQGRFITGETADMRGIPDEYIKNYETKYDWRTTYQNSNVIGITTAANTSAATKPLVAANYGVWSVYGYRAYESWNAGPTQPQTSVADGASMIPSPAASHFGGPSLVYTGNMDKAFGPFFTYFNQGSNATVDQLRADAEKYTTQDPSSPYDLNTFYDSLNLPYYTATSGRGAVTGTMRTMDGTNMDGATIVLSAFNPTAYAADPIGQEYQHRAAGYDYWVTPNKDGTFTLPGVAPGTYRITVIKPGYYREGTFDNITVNANGTTNVGNLTWTPDINGKTLWQIGSFDRTAGEFRDGQNYNNWIDTFNEQKEFPNGVNYTVNPSNPTNDTANWAQNWGLNQINGTSDFWKVNFNLPSAPAANAAVVLTVSIADQEFINDLAVLIGGHRVDAGFDHTANNAPATFRSGDTSSQVEYRKFIIPASWLVAGNNTFNFHIVGGNMQWDALNLSIQNPGTFSLSQWNGGNGNWNDPSQWSTQTYGYTNINKGTANISNDTSTTFADGAANTAPINNPTSQFYYDAAVNGGNVSLNTSPAVQKLSVLAGTLSVPAGPQSITANDAFVLAGGTVTGNGTINALTTTTINLSNTIANGFAINSSGPVAWTDGANLTITGTGSKWTTPGFTAGQSLPNAISLSAGAALNIANGTLTLGPSTSLSADGSSSLAGNITNAGTLSSAGPLAISASGNFTNAGTATLSGNVSGAGAIVNNAGLLSLNGTNTYTGNTTINGGAIQFATSAAIGGAGTSVTINAAGAAAFSPGVTSPAFLARINPASTGSLALTSTDSATTLDFTSTPLSTFANMFIGAVGTVTYTGTLTTPDNTFRLGGGGGTLTFSPLISGTANVTIGNNFSSGMVILNGANTYTGVTTLKGPVLYLNSIANGGAPSPIGSSSNAPANVLLDGGIFRYVGDANGSTDRLFTLTPNGGTIDSSGAGSLVFTNPTAIVASGVGNRTLTLTGSNDASIFAPAIPDPASGVTSLAKTGTGTWFLGPGTKTYSGDTSVLAGTLQLTSGASLPSGAGKGNLIIATAATFEMNGQDLAINALNDGPAPASGTVTTDNPNGWASPNGPGGGTLDNNNAASHTLTLGNNNASGLFSGLFTGNINLVKTGTGTQTLSGDNTYSGTTTINAGTLVIGVGGTPSSDGPGDGGFRGKLGNGTIINNATLVFDRGYLTTCTNIISGTGTLKQIANAELALGANNTYTGPTIIGQGIANLGLGGASDGTGLAYSGDCSLNASSLKNGGTASSIGASSNAPANLVLDGGTLFYSSTTSTSTDRLFTVTQNGAAIYTSGALTFSNTGALVLSGTGDRTLSLGGDSSAASTFAPSVGDPSSGETSLTKDRGATWVLSSAANTYSGDTNILMGTLKVGSAGAIPSGPGKGNIVWGTSTDFNSAFPATLDMNGNNLNVNALIGGLSTYSKMTNSGTLKNLTVGNGNASGNFGGVVSGGLNFSKTGTGTQTLNNANTYTGTTTVLAGELDIAANASLTSTSSVVSPGATYSLLANSTIPATTNLTNNGTTNFNNPTVTINTLNGTTVNATLNLNATALTLTAGGSYAGIITDGATTGALTINANQTVGASFVTTVTLNKTFQISNPSRASTVTLAGTAGNWTGGLNLATSAFILDTTTATKPTALSQLQDQVLFGRSHSAGIFSSSLPANYAVALLDNAVTHFSTFRGQPVDANALLLSPELLGDLNVDGKVDLSDLSALLNNFGKSTPFWTDGNFDSAPTIDLTDLALILNNFGMTNPNASAISAPTPTPEPAALLFIFPIAVAAFIRRRPNEKVYAAILNAL